MAKSKRPVAQRAVPGDVFAYRLTGGDYGALQVFASSDGPNHVELVVLDGRWPHVPSESEARSAGVVLKTFEGIWVEGLGYRENHVGVNHVYAEAEVPWWAIRVGNLPVKSVTIDTVVVGDWYAVTRDDEPSAQAVRDERFPFCLTLEIAELGAATRTRKDLEVLTLRGTGAVDAKTLRVFPNLKQLTFYLDSGQIENVRALADLPGLRELELDGVYALEVDDLPETWPCLQKITIRGGRKAWSTVLKRKLAPVASVKITGLKDDAWIAENLACPFRTWDAVSPALARGAIKAWKEAQRQLAELGSSAGSRAKPILHKFVDELNRLDAKHDIESAERDHAAEVFVAMASEHGVSPSDAAAWFDAWRHF